MSETVWTVDEYCDRILERKTRVVDREDRDSLGWAWARKPAIRFPTKIEAINFVVSRAVARVEKAQHGLALEKLRLSNVRRRKRALLGED